LPQPKVWRPLQLEYREIWHRLECQQKVLEYQRAFLHWVWAYLLESRPSVLQRELWESETFHRLESRLEDVKEVIDRLECRHVGQLTLRQAV
jgi:hypothetical protein